jgi:hypothetical protein
MKDGKQTLKTQSTTRENESKTSKVDSSSKPLVKIVRSTVSGKQKRSSGQKVGENSSGLAGMSGVEYDIIIEESR